MPLEYMLSKLDITKYSISAFLLVKFKLVGLPINSQSNHKFCKGIECKKENMLISEMLVICRVPSHILDFPIHDIYSNYSELSNFFINNNFLIINMLINCSLCKTTSIRLKQYSLSKKYSLL